jgi:hypothetical protein
MPKVPLTARKNNEKLIMGWFLDFLNPDGHVFELCAKNPKVKRSHLWNDEILYREGMVGGWFSDVEEAIRLALAVDRETNPDAVYVTLNPCQKALLARGDNRLKVSPNRTKDSEIDKIKNLLIDIDPERPSDISSSENEHQGAMDLAWKVMDSLSARGWPDPFVGDSGNGAQLIYKVGLKNTKENVELIKLCLKALDAEFSSPEFKVDLKVFNPSRLVKLYGTHARKGENLAERPHRLATSIHEPKNPKTVPPELLNSLAGLANDQKKGKNLKSSSKSRKRFDVEAYLSHYGIVAVQTKPHESSTLYCLAECVFDPSHKRNESAIGQTDDGKLFYQCFHNSCQGRTWEDAKREISGDADLSDFTTVEDGRNSTQSELLVRLADGLELFHTDQDELFATIFIDNHKENWQLHSKVFKTWLSYEFYKQKRRSPSRQALQDAMGVIEGKAKFDGEKIPVHLRLASFNGKIYLDLANTEWEAVEISPDGWTVTNELPVKFKRPGGMKSLPRPSHDGSLSDLKLLLNLGSNDNFILIVSWLMGALSPKGPYPILILQGEQGSAKTTSARIIRSLIDPCRAPLRTLPKSEHDLMIAAKNSLVIAWDNLSGLSSQLSDALCRISTGGGLSTRELYTDDGEVLFDMTRPIILTGIDQVANRQDLIDRSIILELPAISAEKRQPDDDLREEFKLLHPRILGSLCDAISMALRNSGMEKPHSLPRMADFAQFVLAAEPALWPIGSFMEAYEKNIKGVVEVSLQNDTVATAIEHLLEEENPWEGTPSQLLRALRAPDEIKRTQSWPKLPNALSKRIKRLSAFLRKANIDVEFKHSGDRKIKITKLQKSSSKPSKPSSLKKLLKE